MRHALLLLLVAALAVSSTAMAGTMKLNTQAPLHCDGQHGCTDIPTPVCAQSDPECILCISSGSGCTARLTLLP